MPYPAANLGFTGHIYKSIDSTTTLMKLFPPAYPSHPQVMTELYAGGHQYSLILMTITPTSALQPYPFPLHPIRPHGGVLVAVSEREKK